MFREIILPIFRSTRLCVTACGVMHPPRCCRPKAGNIVGCAVVTKSGNLNFLEPSGPLQACNGTDLPLPLSFNQKVREIIWKKVGGGGGGEKTLEGNVVSLEVQSTVVVNATALCNMTLCFGTIF